jgi:hypothetical protein
MAALETRGYLAQSQNHYLCPLPEVQVSKADLAELLAPIFRGEEPLVPVAAPPMRPNASGSEAAAEPEPELIAEGFAIMMPQSLATGAEPFTWREQWLVDCETTTETTHKRAYRNHPARTLTETKVQVKAGLDPDSYEQTQRLLGWRVYVSNDLNLTLTAAV